MPAAPLHYGVDEASKSKIARLERAYVVLALMCVQEIKNCSPLQILHWAMWHSDLSQYRHSYLPLKHEGWKLLLNRAVPLMPPTQPHVPSATLSLEKHSCVGIQLGDNPGKIKNIFWFCGFMTGYEPGPIPPTP